MMTSVVSIVMVFTVFTETGGNTCSTGCTDCSGNECRGCESSYFLSSGSCFPCPGNCITCVNDTHCNSCKPTQWDIKDRCIHKCVKDCLNGECLDENGFCKKCELGKYGPKCQQNCSLCKDGKCDLRECSLGCKSGYYEFKTNTEMFCFNCSSHCSSCTDTKVCTVCNEGYFLRNYMTEGIAYGYCFQCNLEQNCKKCRINGDSTECAECYEGYIYSGGQCIKNNNTCSKGCLSNCDENELCRGECKAGWTGDRCSDSCANMCLTCEKTNANTCKECKGDFYTVACNTPCYLTCTKQVGKQTCRLNDGYCNIGCVNKVWGPFCNQSCSKGCLDDGISEVCDRDKGKCYGGCIDGYVGDLCEITSSTKGTMQTKATATTSASQSKESKNTETTKDLNDGNADTSLQKVGDSKIITGVGVGGGVVILVLVILLIVYCIKKRRKPDRISKPNEEMPNMVYQTENTMVIQEDTGNLYAQPMKPKKKQKHEEREEYIYAQPNKYKKSKKASRKEISEPQNLYDNIAINLDEEQQAVDETNLDILELETFFEGTDSLTESEIVIPTSDTYYNTASLIRSRIQVSDLLKYIKKKTDYDTEFEKLPKGLTRTCNEALKPINIAKNRFNGIYAYDATRVVLQSKNYVNANYIDGQTKSSEYVASLGPTRAAMNKFRAFWEMVWQDRIEKIVMLTHLKEEGKMKCEQYWPTKNERQRYGEYSVSCTAEMMFSEFVVREFSIKKESETRQVTQYHYTAWPDRTVPDSVSSLVEFRDKVERAETPNAGPMMVHCSAGIGRTGTYIALDMLIKEGRKEYYVDIFGCLTALRGQRAHMVQNLEQYIFLHHCVLYALTCDPQPLSEVMLQRDMTDDKIEFQYQNLKEHLMIQSKSVAINGRSKETTKATDIPGNKYQVKLTRSNHDNMNAVYVNGYVETNKFIIAHTPLPKTVEVFVSMLYQEACSCVVCLDEEHVNEKEVGQYIPPTNKVLKFGKFQVACKSSNSKEDFIIRELKISKLGSPSRQDVTINHYQFRGWKSSEKVPANNKAFLNLIKDVGKARGKNKTELPIAVHSSRGSERSSIFCAVYILLEKLTLEKEVSVINTICHVNSRWRSSFEDLDCFRFCYDCVKEMPKSPDKDNYYNVLKI